ncbi:MAG: regulatory iron-sulfur-containing complex subunit RicT [Flavobacteriales bacterium]|nr:regulatory iron-sulfur-containing complex subunit RicT [Flavobacteriales bacterium]
MGCGTGGGCSTCKVSEKRGSAASSVFNWLANVEDAKSHSNKNLVEIQFKMNRKEYFENKDNLSISEGDFVAVEGNSGHDIGKITLIGEIVYYQIKRKKINIKTNPLKKIYRLAKDTDLSKYESAIDLEQPTLKKAKEIINNHKLEMKLVDVEFQGDKSKAVFYYTAEKRVDFRELIKEYSRTFGIRVEMKQIGVRQEAAMVGGIGSCGRELCCTTWMVDFPAVSTSSARYQQLSINPQKISGQCGKLKCCLNFELDSYLDSLKYFPKQKQILKTKKGEAKQIKIDVFKKKLQYVYKSNEPGIFELSLKQVLQIIEDNKKQKLPRSLEEFVVEKEVSKVDYSKVVGQDNINRFDKKQDIKKTKSKNKFKNKNNYKKKNKYQKGNNKE